MLSHDWKGKNCCSCIILFFKKWTYKYAKFQALSGLVILSASLSSTSLFCWHVYLLAHNMTTIEVSVLLQSLALQILFYFTKDHSTRLFFLPVSRSTKRSLACEQEWSKVPSSFWSRFLSESHLGTSLTITFIYFFFFI